MKQTQTREAGSDVSRGSAYSNEAPHKSTEARCAPLPSTTKTISLGSDTSTTLASLRGGLRVGASCTDPVRSSTDEDSSFHLRNIENASADEIMFFRSVRAFDLELRRSPKVTRLCLIKKSPTPGNRIWRSASVGQHHHPRRRRANLSFHESGPPWEPTKTSAWGLAQGKTAIFLIPPWFIFVSKPCNSSQRRRLKLPCGLRRSLTGQPNAPRGYSMKLTK